MLQAFKTAFSLLQNFLSIKNKIIDNGTKQLYLVEKSFSQRDY